MNFDPSEVNTPKGFLSLFDGCSNKNYIIKFL